MCKVTVVILTKNEEANIAECLMSSQWCDAVIVLDAFSSDRTVEIARQAGAQVFLRPFQSFSDQRNAAIDLAETDWIFFVDADERVTSDLAQEVLRTIQDSEYDIWWIPRRNNYFGHWLNFGGFWPDYQPRLGRKGKLHFDPQQKVHERPDLKGKAGYLENPLLHNAYQNIGELAAAKSKYSGMLAEIHFEKGIKPTYHLLMAPILTFFELYFVKRGFKDGWVGFLLSLVWAYYAFDEYRRTCMLWKSAHKNS